MCILVCCVYRTSMMRLQRSIYAGGPMRLPPGFKMIELISLNYWWTKKTQDALRMHLRSDHSEPRLEVPAIRSRPHRRSSSSADAFCISWQFVLICAKRCLVNAPDNETSFPFLIRWLCAVLILQLSKFVHKFVPFFFFFLKIALDCADSNCPDVYVCCGGVRSESDFTWFLFSHKHNLTSLRQRQTSP